MPKDDYYNRAKQEGYRARSAYKLKQIDDRFDVLEDWNTVVDLGAAPGGWLQVADERAEDVIGVDLQRIEPIEGVETIRGDITDDITRERIVKTAGGEVDVVISDVAPDLTGDWNVDHARSVHLARAALDTASEILKPDGSFVVKVFQGDLLDEYSSEVEEKFNYLRSYSPDASRDESSEVYLIAKGYVDAPVSEGDEIVVDIVDTGDEGDGIAKVDGYTLIVEEAEEGESVKIEIEELRSRYGFASKI